MQLSVMTETQEREIYRFFRVRAERKKMSGSKRLNTRAKINIIEGEKQAYRQKYLIEQETSINADTDLS
jgi:hypothetical protein